MNAYRLGSKDIGLPSHLVFWGSQLKVLLHNDQDELLQLFGKSKSKVEELKIEAELTALEIKIDTPINRVETTLLSLEAQLISIQPNLKGINIKSKSWLLNEEDVREALEAGRQLTELYNKYNDILIPEAWNYEVDEMRSNLLEHGNKWYKFLIKDYKKSHKEFRILCKGNPPKELYDKLQYIDDIIESKRLEAILRDHQTLLTEVCGNWWEKLKSDWLSELEISEYLATLHRKIVYNNFPKEILEYVCKIKVLK